MRHSRAIISVAALTALSGCAYVKPSPDAQAEQRYETYGPKFTEEEKAQMSTEEKVAVYNTEVREEDRIICRREKPLGSHFYRERCFTQKELDEARRAGQDMMRSSQSPLPPGGG